VVNDKLSARMSKRPGFNLARCVLVVAISAGAARPQNCPTLTPSLTSLLSKYVAETFDFAPDITVIDNGLKGQTCFRQLVFKGAAPKKIVVLYLSPDQRFLLPELLDTAVDPKIELTRVTSETQAQLLTGESPSRGASSAPITIVEFADFECPYCQKLEQSLARLSDSLARNVRIVFKQFPLEQHPWATRAASVAVCADLQGNEQFWAIHDFFFARQTEINDRNFDEQLGAFLKKNTRINAASLEQCISTGAANEVIQRDQELGRRFHIESTPTIFINGRRKVGIRDDQDLAALLDQASRETRSPGHAE
jgi:protein-disulfide isomerase